jgi:hypothetical protein
MKSMHSATFILTQNIMAMTIIERAEAQRDNFYNEQYWHKDKASGASLEHT